MKKVLLTILDGWGIGVQPDVDAIHCAQTPFYDSLIKKELHSTLITHGSEVGLPEGQMGNSEVGHLNIGAGRIVYQELARINKAIDENTLMSEKVIRDTITHALLYQKPVHFIGLLSDGGVHSHINHLISLIEGFHHAAVPEMYIHAFMDGRDTDPQGGKDYMKKLIDATTNTSASVASMIGRYYAMDRDLRWERINEAYQLLVHGVGISSDDPVNSLEKSYQENITDEFVKAHIINPEGTIKEGDIVFFFNYRTDRPRQIVRALTQESIPDFDMSPLDLHFVSMTNYDESFSGIKVVYYKDKIKNTLGEVLDKHGKSQVRIAETEKYPHVTFFFSGGREKPFEHEKRILISSPKVATYDLAPEMSAIKITDSITDYIQSDAPDFICLNYANADMVGHTGVFEAAVAAAETVDQCLSLLVKVAKEEDYAIIIIADHGNSDIMINPDGSPHTAHTTNPVPVIYIDRNKDSSVLINGKLADIAPTILGLMGIPVPTEMTGNNLIIQN